MSYSLPAGYYPQLPIVVADGVRHARTSFGTGIDGWRIETPEGHDFVVASGDAAKAWKLANGYVAPWRYEGVSLHAMAS